MRRCDAALFATSSDLAGAALAPFPIGAFPVTCNFRWIGAIALVLALASGSARAQPIYGGGYGGYWGAGYGGGGGQTVQGSVAQGMGMYAMGAGQYNVQTAQARAINTNTAMQWNQYIYNSRI